MADVYYPARGSAPAKMVRVTLDPEWKLRSDIEKAARMAASLKARGDNPGAAYWSDIASQLKLDLARLQYRGTVQ